MRPPRTFVSGPGAGLVGSDLVPRGGGGAHFHVSSTAVVVGEDGPGQGRLGDAEGPPRLPQPLALRGGRTLDGTAHRPAFCPHACGTFSPSLCPSCCLVLRTYCSSFYRVTGVWWVGVTGNYRVPPLRTAQFDCRRREGGGVRLTKSGRPPVLGSWDVPTEGSDPQKSSSSLKGALGVVWACGTVTSQSPGCVVC